MEMYKITPEYLTGFVNFWDKDPTWLYRKEQEFDMPKIQAEGAAKLWNLLLDKKVALLADEVGMGKTIQGLAVMTVLWQQKPDAKILLYAPNENVARKWIREYENFIRYHYRVADNVVKSSIRGKPLRQAVYCENHLQLMQFIQARWPALYVCKTSSLSGFLSVKLTDAALSDIGIPMKRIEDEKNASEEALADWMCQFGKACNTRAHELLSGTDSECPPFDLILFDEAHYLRRSEGHSNRSVAAHAFFAGRNIRGAAPWEEYSPLANKALLLTATPNHSDPSDIRNITSLFHPAFRNMSPLDILQEICVRRFRRLADKTKHEYREEIPEGVEMEHLRERLFFAAYHKSLVRAKAEAVRNGQGKSGMDPYRVLFGYLEGFEFLPKKPDQQIENNREVTDFRANDDTDVIVALAKKYDKIYKKHPEHPKYRRIIQELQPRKENNYNPEKKVVFVRRIASVFEISDRVIKDYNQEFLGLLGNVVPRDISKDPQKRARKFFWNLAQREKSALEEVEEREPDIEELQDAKGISNLENTILDLFTIKKEGKYRTTDCSNFRNRFLKKEQIFSAFFEPGADYNAKTYEMTNVLVKQQDKQKDRRQYKTTVQKLRLERLASHDNTRLMLEQQLDIQGDALDAIPVEDLNLETLLTIWLSHDLKNSTMETFISDARKKYRRFSVFEKEGFSQYLEKGLLFASQYVVRFYSIYRGIAKQQGLRGEELYHEFCRKVRLMMEDSGLSALIASAVLTFQRFYKKELGATEENVIRENWSFLNNMLPVYPYCGDTKRESIIKAFNTPFYPNVLVATSVLQEGVDLHYHCSEVIHYGIAWTQGDNEQRVGRVDRMFGKLESRLTADPNATLPIHYPYLKNTIDQDQVARFVLRKHQSEQLLDQLKNVHFSNEINFREQVSDAVWTECFNSPGAKEIIHDPFPVEYEKDFAGISIKQVINEGQQEITGFLDPLINTLTHHFKKEFVLFSQSEGDANIFAIKHIRHNRRHQPVIGALVYSEQGLYFMKKPVYCLRLLTPLARNARSMKDVYNRLDSLKRTYLDNPLLKICLDKSQKGFLKYYVCADLPLFLSKDAGYNLSHNEVIKVMESIVDFTDLLEQLIHSVNFDIRNEEIVDKESEEWQTDQEHKLGDDREALAPEDWTDSDTGVYQYMEIGSQFLNDDEIHAYNHENFFLRKLIKDGSAFVQAGIYKNDALAEECYLLDKILKSI
jgi:superfamily II DNA or RNA helicase